MLKNLKTIILALIALSIVIVNAQEACSAIVEDALLAVEDFCGELGRNQACYGNFDLSAEAQDDAIEFTFEESGDIVDVEDIASLELSELNEELGTWGVAVMSLQADIPNTLPGQNVTFILFGDVFIENASTDEQTPMQAFYLRTGVGTVACEDAPESGVVIQSPDGVDEVTFNVNGVDVQVGSTVLLEAPESEDGENEIIFSAMEGSAAVQFDDENYAAVEGTRIRVPLNDEGLPTGRPGLPEAYDANRIAPLPLAPLPRVINAAPPLPDDNLNQLHERVQNGQPPCGIDGLPPCENILPVLREGGNMPPPDRWGAQFEPGVNCVVRPETTVNAEDLPELLGETQTVPFCPPTERANRPAPLNALANNELPLDGDADGDAILNANDACPMTAGTTEFFGCANAPADSDGDGIVDALDYCPRQSGNEDSRGCSDAPRDSDNDGFPDALDVCPNRSGTAEFRGCPIDPRTVFQNNDADCANYSDPNDICPSDVDGDAVPNDSDRCPDEFGLPENNGCPLPDANSQNSDSDGDGVADDVDDCPNYAGTVNGCPPDTDGDGLYDPQDRCPNQVGTANRNGCPEATQTPVVNSNNNTGASSNPTPDPYGDFDGDGVQNGIDDCPARPGLATNNGCPQRSN